MFCYTLYRMRTIHHRLIYDDESDEDVYSEDEYLSEEGALEEYKEQEPAAPQFCALYCHCPECKKAVAVHGLLTRAFGCETEQTGYCTDGHNCVGDRDQLNAVQNGASLLYGEILFEGVSRMLNREHLDAPGARSLFDLGAGTGKVALQAFLQFGNLARVYGVELSLSRYRLGEAALLRLVRAHPGVFHLLALREDGHLSEHALLRALGFGRGTRPGPATDPRSHIARRRLPPWPV